MIHHIKPSVALVDELTFNHEHDIVEEAPKIRGRLVDCKNYSFIFLICEFFSKLIMLYAVKLSSPEVGSSRKIAQGSLTISYPIDVRFFSPPEIPFTK